MSEWKVTASHRSRAAVIYVRQSTLVQVERNRESTARQYDLVSRARELGWPRTAVTVIDEDLGVSGASAAGRSGFAQLAAQVGMGQVGMVLSLECSRLARNNADWYRLLELAGMTDTLIADADGIYHPALADDRLVLGMKGTLSEMELHILRARLDGAIRNKAARGELRRGLPVGLGLGRGRRGDPDASRRGGHRRHRRDLRTVRGVRVGARGLAMAARPGPEVPAAARRLHPRI
jgi:DNA invertase Pin-like site-specific DNA recombinase